MSTLTKLQAELDSFHNVWPGGYYNDNYQHDSRRILETLEVCVAPYVTGATVLEIGPGRGFWTKQFLERQPQRIYCLDALPADDNGFWEFVGGSQASLVEYHQVRDFECREIPDQSIDYLFSYDVFCHISLTGIDEYLRCLHAKLKPGANAFVMIADADKYRRCCPDSRFVQDGDGQRLDSYDGPPSPGRWYWVGLDRFTSLLERHNYQVIHADIDVNPRDPICHFTIPELAKDVRKGKPSDIRTNATTNSSPLVPPVDSPKSGRCPTHLLVLPLLEQADVQCFLTLVEILGRLPQAKTCFELLLAIHADIRDYQPLVDRCRQLASTMHIHSTASGEEYEAIRAGMFWDAFDFITQRYEDDGGFVLWMESDVLPVKADWLDRLAVEWPGDGCCLIMGRRVTQFPDYLGGGPLPEHLNAVACYSKSLAMKVPAHARDLQPFDFALFEALQSSRGLLRPSLQFNFGAAQNVAQHVADEQIALVHAHAQPSRGFQQAGWRALQSCFLENASDRRLRPAPDKYRGLSISFSLFGCAKKYGLGMLANARVAADIYPGARLRVYHDSTVDPHVLLQLRRLDCELVDMTGSNVPGMFWRLLIHDDPQVSRWISRDADARLSRREAGAVDEWIASGCKLHIMRDHPCHCRSIMGGTIGFAGGEFSMQGEIDRWNATPDYANDEEFLEHRLLPLLRCDVLVHDDFCIVGDHGLPTRPFPTPRVGDNFVGAIYDEAGVIHQGLADMLRNHIAGK